MSLLQLQRLAPDRLDADESAANQPVDGIAGIVRMDVVDATTFRAVPVLRRVVRDHQLAVFGVLRDLVHDRRKLRLIAGRLTETAAQGQAEKGKRSGACQ